jgi:hypothetical protein
LYTIRVPTCKQAVWNGHAADGLFSISVDRFLLLFYAPDNIARQTDSAEVDRLMIRLNVKLLLHLHAAYLDF